MEGVNYYSIFNLLTIIVTMGGILFYILPKQFREALEPYDGLTKLRWQIFWVLGVGIVTSVPILVYQSLRAQGIESEFLRNAATVLSGVGRLLTLTLMVLIFNYKRSE